MSEDKTSQLLKFFRGKRILITGHTGFKGGWLAEILLQAGAEVSGLALKPHTAPNLFDILRLEKRLQSHIADIRDFKKTRAVIEAARPEILFHLAARPIVRESYEKPLETIETNVLGTANVLEAAREVGGLKAIVIITTDKVYENTGRGELYREESARGGDDPYSASKAAADIVATSYLKSFFDPKLFGAGHKTLLAVARVGNVIGGGDWAPDRLLPDIVRGIYEGNGSVALRHPAFIRPWQHVLEPLWGYLILAKKLFEGEVSASGAWNFGPRPEGFLTVQEIAQRALYILGRGTLTASEKPPRPEAAVLKLDIAKAETLLGWEPKLSAEKALELTLAWYKNYYERAAAMDDYTASQISAYFS